jgi:hypothetical protein
MHPAEHLPETCIHDIAIVLSEWVRRCSWHGDGSQPTMVAASTGADEGPHKAASTPTLLWPPLTPQPVPTEETSLSRAATSAQGPGTNTCSLAHDHTWPGGWCAAVQWFPPAHLAEGNKYSCNTPTQPECSASHQSPSTDSPDGGGGQAALVDALGQASMARGAPQGARVLKQWPACGLTKTRKTRPTWRQCCLHAGWQLLLASPTDTALYKERPLASLPAPHMCNRLDSGIAKHQTVGHTLEALAHQPGDTSLPQNTPVCG